MNAGTGVGQWYMAQHMKHLANSRLADGAVRALGLDALHAWSRMGR
jgi:hypothetical protein